MNPKTTKIAKKRYINLRRGAYETIEQQECKKLQRTMHPTGASQMQSNIEVRRCRVSVLNKNTKRQGYGLRLEFIFEN